MFDQQDYYSEEEDNLQLGKHVPNSKVLVPNSGSDFNHLTGEGESLLKMMQQRGLDLTDNDLKKLKTSNSLKQREASSKPKQKAGFFDGGHSASFQQLLKALNRALASADPQQASAVLSHILQKKGLSEAQRNKFAIMKCKILFGLGAYQDCLNNAEPYLNKTNNHIVSATLSNYLAKSKGELGLPLEGYMDFLRARSHLQAQKSIQTVQQQQNVVTEEFADTQLDTLIREIDHTEMEYNIKMSKYKNATNLVHPYYPQLRHRFVQKVSCGDYHTLFLVGGALGSNNSKAFQVMGLGENMVGQILGKPSKETIKEPVVIVQLSGKGVCGINAVRQSSLAWDEKGQIYEWGIKERRDQQINITYNLNEKITQLEKGYQHYACITATGKFYTWGSISFKGSIIYKQLQPYLQPTQNTVKVGCGYSHIVSVDSYGDAFVLGSNENGQLGLQGQLHSKMFRKFNSNYVGPIRSVVCIADATFFINRDEEVYIAGKISYNRQPIQRPRQAQFTGEIRTVTSLVGKVGDYYLTNQLGELYHWEVDSSVKFKIERENEKISQRYVSASHGNLFKIRSLVVPELTKVKLVTQDMRSYEDIVFDVQLFDYLGPYACPNFTVAPRCQIFLSTYAAKGNDLERENKLFLESYQFSSQDTKVLLNQIIQPRLSSFRLIRSQENPQKFRLIINSEQSGKFYFYVMVQEKIVFSQQLRIDVSERQKELSQKNKKQKELKEEERKRKAEIQRQRMLEEKLKRENEQEERRKETQKRAEQTFKKYMREQEDIKVKAEQERKARKDLMTGGGFDLSKLRAKPKESQKSQKSDILERSDALMKTNESFLPDINNRPGSKRKINLPGKNVGLSSFQSVRGQKQASKIEQLGSSIGLNLFKSESTKEKEGSKVSLAQKGADSLSKPGKTVLKRGVSKGKK